MMEVVAKVKKGINSSHHLQIKLEFGDKTFMWDDVSLRAIMFSIDRDNYPDEIVFRFKEEKK